MLAKTERQILPRLEDRISFIYLEKYVISRDSNAMQITTEEGTIDIPSSAVSVLLLGLGTKITQQAMVLAGESGIGMVWTGEDGVKYYASGKPLNSRSNLLLKQAELVSNKRKRAEVARKMYGLRFKDEDVSNMEIQQLLGLEGKRVKQIYKENAEKYGVAWDGRIYVPTNFESSNRINQALSTAHVYPTYVGVIPGKRCVKMELECLPHMCGGYPLIGNAFS